MRKILLLMLIIFSSAIIVVAQSIKGQIKDKEGNTLAGASVQIQSSFKSIISDSDGKFVIKKLKSGSYTIVVTFVGYENLSKTIELSGVDLDLNLVMEESVNLTEEVVVNALRAGRNTPVAYSEINKSEISKSN